MPLTVAVLLLSNIAQRKLSVRQIEARINARDRLEEYLQGIRVMKTYNLLGGKFERLKMAYSDLRRACIRQEALSGPFILFSITLIRAGLTLVILCGAYLLIGDEFSPLTFVVFLVAGSRVFDPLTSALANFAELRYSSIAGGRIFTLMNKSEMGGNHDVPEGGGITFDHVSLSYQEKEILHDTPVTLRKGTLTALAGPSEGRKSAILKLYARFYDPHRGSVRFNGMDMKELELESLMKHCSMVFQDIYLFQDTLKNSIRFGRTDTTSEENEVKVQQAINTSIAGWTVIVIAHHFKTIRNTNRIIMLKEERTAEQDAHDGLLNQPGLYTKLQNIQEQTSGWKL